MLSIKDNFSVLDKATKYMLNWRGGAFENARNFFDRSSGDTLIQIKCLFVMQIEILNCTLSKILLDLAYWFFLH